jgi:hypothetical protein
MRLRAKLVAVLFVALALTAHAREPAMPEASYIVSARFPLTAPSAVVVDVFEVGGTQIGSDVSAAQVQLDAADSDVWQLDLASVSGFAPDCDPRSYVVRFVPDAADCSESGTPDQCAEQLVHSGGWLCKVNSDQDQVVTYPTLPIPARGITSAVISRGNPSYITHNVKIDTASVVFTYYTIFYYDSSGRVAQKLRSLSPPSP